MIARVLVLYDSHGPQMEELAEAVMEGFVVVDGVVISQRKIEEAVGGDMIVADGIILGSLNWSGFCHREKKIFWAGVYAT